MTEKIALVSILSDENLEKLNARIYEWLKEDYMGEKPIQLYNKAKLIPESVKVQLLYNANDNLYVATIRAVVEREKN